MTAFDSDRIGPGTFELVQNPSTGVYTLKKVGFTKLPSLTLPDLTSTATTQNITQTQDQTETNITDEKMVKLPEVGGGDRDETFVNFPTPDTKQDLTGEKTFKNIQQQATNIGTADMGIQMEDISAGSDNRRALAAYNKALSDYNKITELNRDRAMGKQAPTEESNLELANAINEVNMRRKDYENTIVNISDAPIGDFSQGPRTVPTGTLTGGTTRGQFGVTDIKTPITSGTFTRESIDKSFLGEEGTDPNIFNKAKDVISNTKPVQLLGIGLRKGTEALVNLTTSPQQQALNRSNKNALSAVGYKTRGELGGSTDPGRIAGNPADNVFAGMNAQSARGNIMTASKNRIDKIRASAAKTTDKAKAARLNAKADKFEKQRQQVLDKKEEQQAAKNKKDLATGGVAPGASGGDRGGSKKIVCTMMNESYGFGSFRNKIWLRQSKNLAPEYQIGYHKLFLPLVNYAKQKGITNNVVKKILEHIAIHRTIDIRQEEKNKIHLIGRVYRKILEPLCYWAGKK